MEAENKLVTGLQKQIDDMKSQFKNATSYSYAPGYTFVGNLPTELFYAPSIGTPAIADIFSVRQGIRTDEYLVLVNTLEKIVAATTGCSPSYTTAGTLSDRKISVAKISANLQWCKSDFISTASALSNDPSFVGNGLDGYEVTAAVRKMWVDQMVDAIRRDVFRLMFLGNDTSGNANWNIAEGLLAKLYDGNSSYCVKRVSNDLPNQHNSILSTGQALSTLRGLHEGAQIQLKMLAPGEKVFWVTGSMYENLMTSYEATGASNSATSELVKNVVDGNYELKYRGIPVKPLYLIDNYLADDSTCPWYDNVRHFAIYTPSSKSRYSNLVFGTEKASDLDRIDVFYDQRLLTTFAQFEGRYGVQYINCNLTAFAD